jgi:sterol desaturase/sphingolipid hydroxylase (fatty acid hydroxylase superfamily)
VSYWQWLVLVSLAFVALERVIPWRRGQPLLRPGWMRDVGFLAVNGHLFALLAAPLNAWVAVRASDGLRALALAPGASPIATWPFPAQLVAFLVLADFLQWAIHILLHRIPLLWTFHKVHHSIDTMDFIGNFHFHSVEILVYKTLQWLPLAWLGAPSSVLMPVAVFTTAWGHFNHANLDVSLGPLGRVFNSPRMHLWHHDASDEGGVAKNFGIVFSLWDFVFGTAYWPRDRSPARLGYPGDEAMPRGLLDQLVWPLGARRRS